MGSVATSKRKPSYHPRLLDHPMSARPASHPSPRRLASLNKGHRRAVESLVWASVGLHRVRQMQGYLLDEAQAVAHQSVELRAVGQRREGTDQTGACIAVEVPLAREACPSGEDGEGEYLAGAQGCLWSGVLFLLRTGLAELIDHNVECGEEGVLRSTMRSRFLSLRDWYRQADSNPLAPSTQLSPKQFTPASILVVVSLGRSDPNSHRPRRCLAIDLSTGPGLSPPPDRVGRDLIEACAFRQ